jgi:hypothetical protein
MPADVISLPHPGTVFLPIQGQTGADTIYRGLETG